MVMEWLAVMPFGLSLGYYGTGAVMNLFEKRKRNEVQLPHV